MAVDELDFLVIEIVPVPFIGDLHSHLNVLMEIVIGERAVFIL